MNIKILSLVMLLVSSVCFGQIDRSKVPARGPQPEINLEKPTTFELSNGLKVMVVENHKLPKVSVSLRFDNPPIVEGEKAGVSSLTGRVLGKGTTSIPKEDFNKEVDLYGAKLFFNSQGAVANTLTEYFPRILELMSAGVLHPNFQQEELETERKQVLDMLRSQENDINFNSGRLQRALLYGKDHPYGEMETPESVQAVTLEDVKNYYNNRFTPTNAYLLVVGDVKSSKVKDLARKYFGSWQGEAVSSPDFPKLEDPASLQISFLDMPSAVQSKISFTNAVELQKKDPLYFSALVANQVLGGGSESRLFMNLREDKGYTYGSYSKLGDDRLVASFTAGAEVRNAVTDSAITAILEEVKRIRTEPVSEKELLDAKNKLIGQFILGLEKPETIADYAFLTEVEDLEGEFFNNYVRQLEKVTAKDVQLAAQKYFKLDNAHILVAGKGAEVIDKLENYKFEGKKVPVQYFDKQANPVSKPVQEKLDPSMTVTSVFNQYFDAIGGREALNKVKNYRMLAEAEIQGQKLQLEIIKSKDGKFLQAMSMNGNVINKQVFNGKEGYVINQGQKSSFNDVQKAEAAENARLFPELGITEAKLSGTEMLEGTKVFVVDLDANKKAYYDSESGVKLKTVQSVEKGGNTFTIGTTYGDYRNVDGVLFPFSMVQNAGPQVFEFTVKSLEVNQDLDLELFQISG